MDLAFNSRFLRVMIQVADLRKADADDDESDEHIDLTGGDFDPAGEFGFHSTGDPV